MGEIIAVWNSRADEHLGGTTVAIGLAMALSRWGLKKTLLIDYTRDQQMKKYLPNIDIRYTLDFIQTLDSANAMDLAQSMSNPIHSMLDIVGGWTLPPDVILSISELFLRYIRAMAEKYDFVVIDLSDYFERHVIKAADFSLPVIPYHKYRLKELLDDFRKEIYIRDEKAIPVFNAVPVALLLEKSLVEKFSLSRAMQIAFDTNIYYQTNAGDKLYQYLAENITKNDSYIDSLLELAFEIMKRSGCLLPAEDKPNWIKQVFQRGLAVWKKS